MKMKHRRSLIAHHQQIKAFLYWPDVVVMLAIYNEHGKKFPIFKRG